MAVSKPVWSIEQVELDGRTLYRVSLWLSVGLVVKLTPDLWQALVYTQYY